VARVLRAETGQQYEIADGRAAYLAEITEVSKSAVRFRVLEELGAGPPLAPLALYVALFKFDRFEWMIEKATELGVARIVPVETARSEAGLLAAAAKRVERWRKIAREASQQSRRVRVPEVADAVKLAAAKCSGLCLRLEEQAGPPLLSAALDGVWTEVSVLTGPEGGWTDGERERLNEHGWRAVSLGPTVLRAETAAIAAAAIVAHRWLAV
jgi:16S rRNA (uracil1498-N3)-methyltransferase